VFISYSHDDAALAQRIAQHLVSQGMMPMWDKTFSYGHGFHEQIKRFIAHAHIFLPVITEASSRRGVVHQEIGYAMALNVPVLPVTVGIIPGEMLQPLHVVSLEDASADLGAVLRKEALAVLVEGQDEPTLALYTCADESEDRAMLMRRYASDVLHIGQFGKVRQSSALSSFHIPTEAPDHPLWKTPVPRLGRST